MNYDVPIKNGIVIPSHEIELITSRSGGPGGQHVNTTNTRVTLRWNIKNTHVLTPEQKEYVMQKLQAQITTDGDIIIHASQSRSQMQNRKLACERLAHMIRAALHVPKKRLVAKISKSVKEKRLRLKKQHSKLKASRAKKFPQD